MQLQSPRTVRRRSWSEYGAYPLMDHNNAFDSHENTVRFWFHQKIPYET